ncbi:hypothetical protein [Natrinema halophilum]|uniref:hypothetical protein n=1 Tax=Natrinema halophilum TaxID=1699371 RepID=UPI001F3F41FF|nr:hypothetical protein [Natrinema halophilum]UHQ96410.1 hypothetical protein HYG82_23505 [Natrinema halophilum]
MAKYEPDTSHWDEDEESNEFELPRTQIKTHEIEVIYTTDPGETRGYGREKYSATIRYDDETGDPFVLFVVEYRWKGNYWRDVTDWDWRDVPEPVRKQIAAALPVRSPDELDSGARLIDEGGESRWEKYHKHRVEELSGDEMWGTSFLRDALDPLESAAEAFDDGSKGERLSEKLVTLTQKVIRTVDDRSDAAEGGDRDD